MTCQQSLQEFASMLVLGIILELDNCSDHLMPVSMETHGRRPLRDIYPE